MHKRNEAKYEFFKVFENVQTNVEMIHVESGRGKSSSGIMLPFMNPKRLDETKARGSRIPY